MPYLVKLDAFEGPLDLLLHLISKSKVRIEDISITDITSQYLDYLYTMQSFDIEIASEFLVMAATLLHIKSCCLLPKTQADSDEDADESDPREELITKLLEYKKYKKAGEMLRKMESLYTGIYCKLPEEFILDDTESDFLSDIDAVDLYNAFVKVLANKQAVEDRGIKVHSVIRDTVTLPQRIAQLKKIFSSSPQTTFYSLFDDANDRSEVVITFLALLELLRDNFIVVEQARLFDDIVIKRRGLRG